MSEGPSPRSTRASRTARGRLAGRQALRRAERRDRAGRDEIVCLLCGAPFKAITFSHLRSAHGMAGATPIREYKRRFGLRIAVSSELNERQRRVRVAWFQLRGMHWSRTRIYGELRRLAAAGRSLGASDLPPALYGAILRVVGSHELALRRAGIDPAGHRRKRVWDGGRVLASIGAMARLGPATRLRAQREDPGLVRAAVRRFGCWRRALAAAGLRPAEHTVSRRTPLEAARLWILARRRRPRSIRSSVAPSALKNAVERDSGTTWARYVESLGIRYPGGVRHVGWTRKAVLAALRQRRRMRRPLNMRAVAAESQALIHQARRHLGSWDAALRAAGIDPAAVRRRRTWTRADVIAGIRERAAAGRPLSFRGARAEAPRLVKAAQARFPYSWARALAAAGIDPGRARDAAPRAPRGRRRPQGV